MSSFGFKKSLFGFNRSQVLNYIDKQSFEYDTAYKNLQKECDDNICHLEKEHSEELKSLNNKIADLKNKLSKIENEYIVIKSKSIQNCYKIESLESSLTIAHEENSKKDKEIALLSEENSKLKDIVDDLKNPSSDGETDSSEIKCSPIYRYENTNISNNSKTDADDKLFEMVRCELADILEEFAKKIGTAQRNTDNVDLMRN